MHGHNDKLYHNRWKLVGTDYSTGCKLQLGDFMNSLYILQTKFHIGA